MKRSLVIIATLALAGCPGLKRHSTRNAPGIVDIHTPPPVLNTASMDPSPNTQDPPSDPGMNQLGVAPGVWVNPGFGRMHNNMHDSGALEVGVQLHVSFGETDHSLGRDAFGYPNKGWGATLGWGIVQVGFDDQYDAKPETPNVMGPITLEATRHIFYGLGASAGLVMYPTTGPVGDGSEAGMDMGGQISVFASMFSMRLRYVQDSGLEFFGGYTFWLPASITWSR